MTFSTTNSNSTYFGGTVSFGGEYYIYDMGEGAYNEMGFVSDETSTAKEKYINYLVAQAADQ